jgi:Zn-dependent M16 (insulinase) family peptidase
MQVASRNRADFNNLMDVYLDAVFHPRAVEEEGWWVLRQEGWRYEEVVAEDDDDDAEDGGGRRRERLLKTEFEYKG